MKPIVVLSNVDHQCVTFAWLEDLRYFVGYRFVEHSPTLTSTPLSHPRTIGTSRPPFPDKQMYRADNWLDNWLTTYSDPNDPLNLRFQTFADGTALASVVENDGLQEREWRFVPEMTGVRIWMTLTTYEPIPAGYILQQCLRFTSGIGFGFGPTVAKVPFLSELLMQALGNANGTLTWARMNGSWQALPVQFTRFHTPSGFGVYQDSSGQVDCGLIVRESASRADAPASYWSMVAPDAAWETWVAGLYWERSAYVSNRHPADCLHAGVDMGPLEPGEARTVQGKFYWLEGTKEDIYSLWQKEFGE